MIGIGEPYTTYNYTNQSVQVIINFFSNEENDILKHNKDLSWQRNQPRRRVVGPFLEGVLELEAEAASMGTALRFPLAFSEGAFQ